MSVHAIVFKRGSAIFLLSFYFFSRMTSCIEVMTWSHQFGFHWGF
jgi:hypothetical protein